MKEWFLKLLDSTTIEILIPAMILAFVASMLIYVLWKAQSREDFDVAMFLKDEHGNYSALRAWGFICIGLHSWWVATLVFQKRDSVDHFLYYGLIWAGTPVLVKFAERWTGNLPFAQAGTGPVQQILTPPAPPPPPPPPGDGGMMISQTNTGVAP